MSKGSKDSRTADKFVIRLPDGMRDRIHLESGAALTSMNTYIIQSVAMRFEKEERLELLIKLLEGVLARESTVGLSMDFLITSKSSSADIAQFLADEHTAV